MGLRYGRFAALALAAGLALGACQAPPPAGDFPALTFQHVQPVVLDVGLVQVEEVYRPPMGPPHVDHLAPTPPIEAVRHWAERRFQAAGDNGTLRVIIKDASIREVPLDTRSGVTGLLTREQAERYDGRLEVELVAEEPDSRFSVFTATTVQRSTTVPEGASIYEREKTLFSLVERMMQDLDGQVEASVGDRFAPLIVTP